MNNDVRIILTATISIDDMNRLIEVIAEFGYGAHIEEGTRPYTIHLPARLGESEAEMIRRGELLAKVLCTSLKKCLVCGTAIDWDPWVQGWSHLNPDACRLGHEKLEFPPPPLLDEETEPRTTEVRLPRVRKHESPIGSFDTRNRVDRYRAVGSALIEAFGLEWLALRGQVRGLGTDR